jgi:DNA-binding transcriptional regulator YdaS (Cro superfamily)
MDAVTRAARVAGSQAALARALGVTPVTVGQWLKPKDIGGRQVPAKQCLRIERLTNGQVTRRDLRPHDYHEIWPDLDLEGESSTAPAAGEPSDRACTGEGAAAHALPPGVQCDRRDPTRISPYAGSDIDRRALAGKGV